MSRPIESAHQRVGVLSSVKGLTASIVSHMHIRLALLVTELAEEKIRLTSIMAGMLIAAVFLFAAINFSGMFVLAAYWDTEYRLYAAGGLVVVFVIGTVIFWSIVQSKLKSKSHLFEASLEELYKDRQHLSS